MCLIFFMPYHTGRHWYKCENTVGVREYTSVIVILCPCKKCGSMLTKQSEL